MKLLKYVDFTSSMAGIEDHDKYMSQLRFITRISFGLKEERFKDRYVEFRISSETFYDDWKIYNMEMFLNQAIRPFIGEI